MQKRSERNKKLQENINTEKFECGLKKTKIMIVRTGKGKVEQIQERVS